VHISEQGCGAGFGGWNSESASSFISKRGIRRGSPLTAAGGFLPHAEAFLRAGTRTDGTVQRWRARPRNTCSREPVPGLYVLVDVRRFHAAHPRYINISVRVGRRSELREDPDVALGDRRARASPAWTTSTVLIAGS
jgi:hypothetical protein